MWLNIWWTSKHSLGSIPDQCKNPLHIISTPWTDLKSWHGSKVEVDLIRTLKLQCFLKVLWNFVQWKVMLSCISYPFTAQPHKTYQRLVPSTMDAIVRRRGRGCVYWGSIIQIALPRLKASHRRKYDQWLMGLVLIKATLISLAPVSIQKCKPARMYGRSIYLISFRAETLFMPRQVQSQPNHWMHKLLR